MDMRYIFLQIVEKPQRKVLIKRGNNANDYWSYSEEVGCEIWEELKSITTESTEPICMWLPEKYRSPNTSEYVQGIELPIEYKKEIPEGFDIIILPKSKYLMFQGEPFEEDNFEAAIEEIWKAEEKYNPSIIGYKWDEENPKIQLEPVGERGYIELIPIKEK